jgi:hypothetical protein
VLQDPFWSRSRAAAGMVGTFAAGASLGAGAAWAAGGTSNWGGALVFLAVVALLWLGGARTGSRSRVLSPGFAFFVVVTLLGAIFHLSAGALP